METSKRIFNNTIFLYSAETIALFFGFALSVVIARTLGSLEFGKLAFVNSIIAITAVLADPGISYYLIKQGSQQRDQIPKLSGLSFIIRLSMAVLTCTAVIFYSSISINDATTRLMTIVMSLTLIVNVIPSIIGALLRIQERMRIEAIIRAVTSVLYALTGIILILNGAGIQMIAWLTFGTAILSMALFLVAWKKTSQSLPIIVHPTSRFISFLKNATPFAVLTILSTIYFRIDVVMIEYLRGSNDVGLYSAAYRIIEGLLLIPWVFSGVLLPVIAKNIKNNVEQVRVSTHHVLKLLLIIAIPLTAGIVLFSSTIIKTFFGGHFGPSVLVLQLLAPTFIAVFISSITSTIISSSDRPIINSYIAAGMVVINVTINLLLIPRIGIAGAALATFVTELVGLAIGTIYINNFILSLDYLSFLIKPILASALMAASIILIPSLWGVPLFIGIYGAAIFIMKGIDTEDIRLIKSIIQRKNVNELPTS